MVLPDTSISAAYLRTGAEGLTQELNLALDRREVLACGPVVAELVAGARPRDRAPLIASLTGLPWAEVDHNAGRAWACSPPNFATAVKRCPLTDVEIAVAAHKAGATRRLTARTRLGRLLLQSDTCSFANVTEAQRRFAHSHIRYTGRAVIVTAFWRRQEATRNAICAGAGLDVPVSVTLWRGLGHRAVLDGSFVPPAAPDRYPWRRPLIAAPVAPG